MANYRYKAHDRKSGKEVVDNIKAGSQAEAIAMLKKMGLLPIEVKESTEKKKKVPREKIDWHISNTTASSIVIAAFIIFLTGSVMLLGFSESPDAKKTKFVMDYVTTYMATHEDGQLNEAIQKAKDVWRNLPSDMKK